MNPPKSIKESVEQYFLSHKGDSYNLEHLIKVFGAEHEPAIVKALKELQKRSGIFERMLMKDSFKDGFYRLNPEYKTLEDMRAAAEKHSKENPRVYEGEVFDPTKSALIRADNPNLPSRRLHFRSIVDRMSKSPSFSPADVELLKAETPHLNPE